METVVLNHEFIETIETVRDVTNYFCKQLLTGIEHDPFDFRGNGWYDRNITSANVVYADDVFISVTFLWKGDQQTWIGWIGDSQKYLGYIEISKTRHTNETPVSVRIVDGGWPPLGMFWRQLADKIWDTLNPNNENLNGKRLTQIIESTLAGLPGEYDVKKRTESTRVFFDVVYCQGATGSLSRWIRADSTMTLCRFETTLLRPVWRVIDETRGAYQNQFVHLTELIENEIENGIKRQNAPLGQAGGQWDVTESEARLRLKNIGVGKMRQDRMLELRRKLIETGIDRYSLSQKDKDQYDKDRNCLKRAGLLPL